MGKILESKVQVGVIIDKELRATIEKVAEREEVKLSAAIRYLLLKGVKQDMEENK